MLRVPSLFTMFLCDDRNIHLKTTDKIKPGLITVVSNTYNPSSSQAADSLQLTQFLPIAPRQEDTQAVLPSAMAKKYDTPDFLTTVRSIREKLFDLQGNSVSEEEPTLDGPTIKKWKASSLFTGK